jgi:uncharacterized protein
MPRRLLAWLALAALAACTPRPEPAHPAFWQIEGPHGERGWLLGTIHALARPAAWRSPAIDTALADSTLIAVEIANLDDSAAMADAYARLSRSDGLPPLSARVDPELRAPLTRLLKEAGKREADFAGMETWAAALTLARAGAGSLDSKHGIDRAVLKLADGRPVVELEGAERQLGLFDAMPEREQRDLLSAVVRDDDSSPDGSLAEAWRNGDFARIEAETRRGMLADPELREALFTGRNRAWTARIAGLLGRGERVFVAVGAAHMAGEDGVPEMLRARGFTVRRIQ